VPRGTSKEEARYKPYLLTRLTDNDPHIRKALSHGYNTDVITMRQLKKDIFENIEVLFNSRTHLSSKELKGDSELESSVLGYGISDFCGKLCSGADKEKLRLHILKQLKNFEPRLAPDSIKVEFMQTEQSAESLMEFRISAYIAVGSVSEEVLFISKLDMETGNADVESLKG
jgi:type VI secretion system lysozyme-like protein